MFHIAICDDDPLFIEKLESYLDKLQNNDCDYDVFFDALELSKYLKSCSYQYDVYFLDIEMKQLDGLTLAKNLRKKDLNPLIIFLTSYPKYVFDVFDVFAFDFIIKPVTINQFEKVLNKVRTYLAAVKKRFTFSYRKNTFSIPLEQILYIEKSGRKAFIHTKEETYQCNMTLDDIWKQLDYSLFVSIHISCIVNLSYVSTIVRDELTLTNGSKLFIGRNYCQKTKLKHLNFIRSQL